MIQSTILVVLLAKVFAGGFAHVLASKSDTTPPLIIRHPTAVREQYYSQKAIVLLHCFSVGGPVRFSWYRNKVPVMHNPIPSSIQSSTSGVYFDAEPPCVNGSFNGSLVIFGISEATTGAYQCFASLIAQPQIRAMSEIAYVHLNKFMSFHGPDREPKTLSVTEGGYVSLPCPSLAMSPPPHVTWEVIDHDKLQLIDNRRIVLDDQGTLHILSVMSNGSEFAGQLQCVQSNARMAASARGRITTLTLDSDSQTAASEPTEAYVSRSPKYILTAPTKHTEVNREYGDALHAVYCIFYGNPLPTVRWTRLDNQEMGPGVVAHGAQLHFRNATMYDNAMYLCTVYNNATDTGSDDATQVLRLVSVLVRSAPQLLPGVTRASRVEKTVGEDVVLDCSAQGVPAPVYKWFFNTYSLDELLANQTQGQAAGNYSLPKLDLKKVSEQNVGVYSCNVSNRVGFTFHSFSLSVYNESRVWTNRSDYNESNRIELTCTAQVDARLAFRLYWRRLATGGQKTKANMSLGTNDTLQSMPELGVHVNLTGFVTTLTFDLNITSFEQRRWLTASAYECVLQTKMAVLSARSDLDCVEASESRALLRGSTSAIRPTLHALGTALTLVMASNAFRALKAD